VGIDGTEPPLDSIPKVAARYVKEIQASGIPGPYVLSGYSIGGIIAFELAQQMQDAGLKVSRVIVFDLLAPGYPKQFPIWHRLRLHSRRFLKAGWKDKRKYLRERVEHLRSRILARFGHYTVAPEVVPGVDIIPHQRVRAVLSGLLKGWSHYWPQKPFDGEIVMMSSTEPLDWVGSVFDDPCKGWSRWTTQPVKLYPIDAPHTLFFRDEYVEQVVGHVREVLQAVGADHHPADEKNGAPVGLAALNRG
jgi:thioesterase domain-containing protein